mmetsp:Transcript_9708/g.14904  ORF Transcript_9708/g.14904 Transcript_9708/m.14904 type:complete len:556 (+) Transcript_9708:39-1706(+)
MAEETKVEEQPSAEVPAAPAVEKKEEESTENKNGKKDGGKNKKDETPVEELFDLSKPIPRVDRPSKENHEKDLQAISDAMDSLKKERSDLQNKIDSTMDAGKNSEVGKAKEALSQLRSKKNKLINEKKSIRAKLDSIKNQGDRIQKDRQDAKQGIRFTKMEDIEAEIKKLQSRQETTSMSLPEEKRLIKEIDALVASKKLVADLKSKDASLDDVREQRKMISAQINAKDKEIDAVQKEIDERQANLKTLSDKQDNKRDALKGLFNKRDELRKKMNGKMKERDALRAEYREKNNSWYNYQRAVRAQKKIQYEEERKKREEEQAEWLKKKEEEEAKKIPYEAEQALCDYLANYLTQTYLVTEEEKKRQKEAELEAKRQAEVVAVKEDPFAGFKPAKKEEEVFFSKGKGGKKKKSRGKKALDKGSAGPFTINMDSFEQFGLLNLTPPTSLELVAKSVEELKAKKQWYSEQPRGSVPTAAEIRKTNEKAAAKLRQTGNGDVSTASQQKKSSKKGGFDLSDADFTPLGSGAASSSINGSWGQKPASEEIESAAPVEAEEM